VVDPTEPASPVDGLMWTDPTEDATVPVMVPIGSMMMWPVATAPSGWLICDGGSFSAATYPDLATVLGGTTLPDMRTRFPVGVGSGHALGATGGAATVALALANIPAHTHSPGTLSIGNNDAAHQHPMGHTHDVGGSFISDVASTGTGGRLRPTGTISTTTSSIANTGNQSGPHQHGLSGSTGDGSLAGLAGTAHENRPPYMALHFIIKAGP
jgi:microcystin-dependent protein